MSEKCHCVFIENLRSALTPLKAFTVPLSMKFGTPGSWAVVPNQEWGPFVFTTGRMCHQHLESRGQ